MGSDGGLKLAFWKFCLLGHPTVSYCFNFYVVNSFALN